MKKKSQKILLPIFDPTIPDQNILSIMNWLHDQGCAVVIWTEKELRGVNVDDLEASLIEWGSEAILMNATEEEEEEEEEETP